MKTLKKIAFASGLALWAWLGNAFPAAAQVLIVPGVAETCDSNGSFTDMVFGCYAGYSGGQIGTGAPVTQYCHAPGYECMLPVDAGLFPPHGWLPNGAQANPALSPVGVDCASSFAINCTGNFNCPGSGYFCCAGPGNVLSTWSGVLHDGGYPNWYGQTNAGLFCELDYADSSLPWGGYGGVPYPDMVNSSLYCPVHTGWAMFDGGGPCWDQVHQPYKFVDAGTSALGGPQHLLKANVFALDAGFYNTHEFYEPLGFEGTSGAAPAFIAPSGPPYDCTMPFYKPDGGWLEADLGNGHADLLECTSGPNFYTGSDGPFFPCCGDEPYSSAGALCKQDGAGVSHCACIQDGNRCDDPRYLDIQSSTQNPGLQSMGECCSPGLNTQVYSLGAAGTDGGSIQVITGGQGFCKVDANGLSPSVGSRQAPGWCNCLPLGVPCTMDYDCCGNSVSAPGHGFCSSVTSLCGCSNHGQVCGSNHDCCGTRVCLFDGGAAGNYCST